MMHRYAVFNQSDATGPEQATADRAVRTFVRDASALRFAELAGKRNPDIVYVVRRLNTPIYKPSRGPLGKAWIDLGSDVNWADYGGTWGRPVKGSNDLRWWIIRFDNWSEHERDPEVRYMCELAEVDLTAPEDQRRAALSYTGAGQDGEPLSDVELAYSLHAYGAKAPIYDESSNNSRALLDVASAMASELERDQPRYKAALDRPVNAIGSTAREYQLGDINSAILRGVAEGDPKAELMLKMGMGR